jgi:3',5'-cyclic-AMP phosphodiesterase
VKKLIDLHLVEPGQDWPQGVDPLARLRVCFEEVRTLQSDAERIVVSGDLVQLRNPRATASCAQNWSSCRRLITY